MLLFSAALAGVSLIDISTAYYAGPYHRGDPPPFADLIWRKRPAAEQIAKLIPRDKLGNGYGHVKCWGGISRSGRLIDCRTDGSPSTSPSYDVDYEKAALKAVRLFRVDRSFFANSKRKIEFIGINFDFNSAGQGWSHTWGDCQPFCVVEGPPPPPPPPLPTREK